MITNKKQIANVVIMFLVIAIACGTVPSSVFAASRIKDLAYFQGARENQLIGYGLVVGLAGTGDKAQSVFTVKSIASLLSRMGIDVSASQISPKNVAAVMVTATLPPFVSSGARIDVTLSSLGDASSLAGGTLLLTPLAGADNNVYAVAQGQISVGGMDSSGGGKSNAFSTVARIPQGALIERDVPVAMVNAGSVKLSLKTVDFTTCVRIAEAINASFASPLATPVDGGTITIRIPDAYRNNLVGFLAAVENVQAEPDARAKVIINERTGTIVGGKNVKVGRVSVAHKNINIDIKPAPEAPATAVTPPASSAEVSGGTGHEGMFIETSTGEAEATATVDEMTIGEVAQLLNSLSVRPADMIAIFQAIREAGALSAELEII